MKKLILDHNTKPTPVFLGKNDGIWLGVELELEAERVSSSPVMLARDIVAMWIYTKEDASLKNGVELVTHPASLEFHRDKWSGILSHVRSHGLRAAKTCGLHIHICKEAVDVKALVRFAWENRRRLEKLARRRSDYAEFKSLGMAGRGRYEAVNIIPQKTVEVRMFASTVWAEKLFVALEFCHAVARYTQTNSVEWKGFVKLAREDSQYGNLRKELEMLGII